MEIGNWHSGIAISAYDSSTVDISGGRITDHLTAHDSSIVDIAGGTFTQHVYAYDSSQVTVSRGRFERLSASGSSTVHLFGGTLGTPVGLTATQSGTLYVRGSGFNYPPGPIPGISGTLTGTLASGSRIDTGFVIMGYNRAIIIVPEPSSLWLTAMAALAGPLVYTLRRRNDGRACPIDRNRHPLSPGAGSDPIGV